MTQKIFKTLVPMGAAIYKMDTIEHDGRFWLVPEWLQEEAGIRMKPLLMIDLSALPHQQGGAMADFVLNHPLPEGALEGAIEGPLAKAVKILHQPDIWFAQPEKFH